ncbi:hypothetical protein BXZ70DRAFT_997629 [Cristinia sonorae]|uniref:PIN domain-containing protein n=1 Tax=Cristinia sonorae TaxID=1940300 RepID=A0A8K0V0Q3_9AGAR|nr:hypothetical protein BXZ70DRAFT_997629 [Cristinia sonorae]
MQDPSSSRKGKDRSPVQPTSIADKLVALQRKQARSEASKPKERQDRPAAPSSSSRPPQRAPSPRRMLHSPLPTPDIVVSHPVSDPYPDEQEFSRRLKISATSPRASHSKPQNGGPSAPPKQLYNPNTDPIRRPLMTAEPDAMSDAGSSSYAPRAVAAQARHHGSPQSRGEPPRLFDPRKDNPHKFSAQTRPAQAAAPSSTSPNLNGRPTPTPKSSGDYVSASSTSSASYAQSTISSNFTLSSNTTDSSQSSAIFDSQRRSEDSAGPVNALSVKLKKLYRTISALEDKVAKGDAVDEETDRDGHRVLMKSRQPNGSPRQDKVADEEAEREKWKKLIGDHKELADHMHHMLTLTSAPTVPSSLRNVPTKYSLPIRLWTNAFHRLLENLRRAAMNSVVALEHLQEFIYYAYAFYGYLLEERNLASFRDGWLEALGDLARYRILVSRMVEGSTQPASALTTSAVARVHNLSTAHLTPRPLTPAGAETSALSEKAASPTPAARIDDSPPPSRLPQQPHLHNAPSVGVVAARMMELEPEPERWRQIARLWYAKGLAATPGVGKLHHHLGLLSRERETDEEMRAVYHFIKGMTCTRPFSNSRESILPLWSVNAQARRQAPDARPSELFILLHGMLFTNIQLDDFKPILARFEEKLLLDGGDSILDREWIMMAVINLASILEYGRPTAVLRQVSGIEGRAGPTINGAMNNPAMAAKVKLMVAKKLDGEKMDVDGEVEESPGKPGPNGTTLSPVMSEPASTPTATEGPELPTQLKLALQLTFAMLSHTFRKPTRQTTPFAPHMLNPYITIIFTFLATILKDRHTLHALERSIPWEEIAAFLNSTLSRRLLAREQDKERNDGGMLLTSGTSPLPEDWCLRGLGWGGKKVYERGFWGKDATGDEENVEMEILDKDESQDDVMDGIIEEDDDDKKQQPGKQEMHAKMVRVTRAALKIAKVVPGFSFTPPRTPEGRGEWKVEGVLADKVARWREQERQEREEEERRARGTRWDDDSMEVDEDEEMGDGEVDVSDDSEDCDQDSHEVKALKARRRYLQSLLQSSQHTTPSRRNRSRVSTSRQVTKSSLHVVPGYTILVVDTNILLSSLSIFSSLVESLKWTIVIPLPVIMELDGLATNESPLGQAAAAATAYIVSHLRSHGKSLKVQTSKGNYLTNLSVRTEQVEWNNNHETWERNVDDLILRAAVWQNQHWMDRSSFFGSSVPSEVTASASKVTLLSFDRMLRLKARAREVDAANEQDLAAIMASVS